VRVCTREESSICSGQWLGEGVILSLIEITAAPGNRDKITELLQFSAESLETRAGCQSAGVYLDDERCTVLYVERWTSEDEYRRHVQSVLYLGVLNALDLAQAPPKISIHTVSSTKSFEFIEELRNSRRQ